MFVSESKFRQAPHEFIPHILSTPPNREALAGLITKPAVEAALLVRLGNKARLFGAELDAQGNLKGEDQRGEGRIKTDEVVKLYRDWVIPLTKDVEVDYLEHRLEGVEQGQIDEWMRAGEGK
jgi:chorismate mutase